MALPDFPDYNKWGFSLVALNNDVYVTGRCQGCWCGVGFPRSRDGGWGTKMWAWGPGMGPWHGAGGCPPL